MQVVLRSVLCCTSLKFFESGALLAIICRKCGEKDSCENLASCVERQLPDPTEDPGPRVLFLAELVRRAFGINAGMPAPRRDPPEGEIALTMSEDSERG